MGLSGLGLSIALRFHPFDPLAKIPVLNGFDLAESGTKAG
jgi:hypothetical protein